MDNRVKYTQEQRQQAYDLYWEGRSYKEHPPFRPDKPNKMKRMSGTYTCAQIAEMTGVHPISVSKIARCEQ